MKDTSQVHVDEVIALDKVSFADNVEGKIL